MIRTWQLALASFGVFIIQGCGDDDDATKETAVAAAAASPAPSDPCACIGNQGVAENSTYSADIGNSCDAWDGKEQYCIDYAADSKLDGGANDWCPDDWCYVDPLTCDQPVYKSTYFTEAEMSAKGVSYLYFSYKSCDADFMGNSWVGFCECTGNKGASDGSSYGVNMGGANVGLEDVRGCKPWDGLEQNCIDYAADTKETCRANDWCPDKWCYVDPTRCDKPTYASSYFAGVDLHFSYSTCEEDFVGNSWVGQSAEGASTCPSPTVSPTVSPSPTETVAGFGYGYGYGAI